MTSPLVQIEGLTVEFPGRQKTAPAVNDLTLDLPTGLVSALMGESGSGKSVTASAIAGLLPVSAQPRVSGSIRFDGNEIANAEEHRLRRLRGNRIGTIFQNPASSFDPSFTIGNQLVEFIRVRRRVVGADARDLASEWLARVGLDDTERVLASYPHQLSGGMRQRVMIAVACIPEPDLLIADEPTTALDPTISAQILDLIDDLRRELGMTVLLVTHDFGVVARISDRVAVLRRGHLVEHGATGDILRSPRHAYTRRLISAVPELSREHVHRPSSSSGPTLLRVSGVTKHFSPASSGSTTEFTALDQVDLTIPRGRAVGLIGESGSGKSTLARIIAGIESPTSGEVRLSLDDDRVPVTSLSRIDRARLIQLVFQDHGSALNPRVRVGEQIARPLRRIGIGLTRADVQSRVENALDRVGLDIALASRYPHQLSGGQRQRAGIARALAVEPSVVLLDEPTSALDVTTQRDILALLGRLRDELNLTFVLISHDLAVVQGFADDVVVLDRGRIVDRFRSSQFHEPDRHEVTRRLVEAVLPVEPSSEPPLSAEPPAAASAAPRAVG